MMIPVLLLIVCLELAAVIYMLWHQSRNTGTASALSDNQLKLDIPEEFWTRLAASISEKPITITATAPASVHTPVHMPVQEVLPVHDPRLGIELLHLRNGKWEHAGYRPPDHPRVKNIEDGNEPGWRVRR